MVGPLTCCRMFRLCQIFTNINNTGLDILMPTCSAAFGIISLGEIPRSGISDAMPLGLHANAQDNAHVPFLYLYRLHLDG